jgi:hypothetical protein
MDHRFTKHYTVEEARALLPQVRQWLEQLQQLMERFTQLEKRLQSLSREGGDLGGPSVNEWARLMVEMSERFGEFHRREIIIKDLSRGLLDFPSLRNQREIYLCWEQDEEDIQFWHDLDSGYSGRERI